MLSSLPVWLPSRGAAASLPARLWSVSELPVAIRWHLSYTSPAFLSLSAVFELLTRWQPDGPSGERVVPCVTSGFLKETPETPNGRDQRKGESHLFFISCQRAVSRSTGNSICLISLFVSLFQTLLLDIRPFETTSCFSFFPKASLNPLSPPSKSYKQEGHWREGGFVLLLVGQNKD